MTVEPLNIEVGQRVGKLTVLELVGTNGQRARMWHVKCDCGRESRVATAQLRIVANSGKTGCLVCSRRKRGHGHAQSDSRTYASWLSMRERCYYERAVGYARYGGRGITVCDRWRWSFANFLADMGERPDGMTLDRVNPNGNYEPSNCRWATVRTQNRNRTSTRLTAEDVLQIHALHILNVPRRRIATALGFSSGTVDGVISGDTWRDIVFPAEVRASLATAIKNAKTLGITGELIAVEVDENDRPLTRAEMEMN